MSFFYTHSFPLFSSSFAFILLFDCFTRNWKKWRVEGSLSRHSNCASSVAPSCSAAISTSTSSLALTASVLRASHSRLKTCFLETQRSWSTRTPALHYTTLLILPLLYLNIQCDVFRSIYSCIDLICLIDAFYRTVRALEARLRSLTPRTRQVHHVAPTPYATNFPHSSDLKQLSTILVQLKDRITWCNSAWSMRGARH